MGCERGSQSDPGGGVLSSITTSVSVEKPRCDSVDTPQGPPRIHTLPDDASSFQRGVPVCFFSVVQADWGNPNRGLILRGLIPRGLIPHGLIPHSRRDFHLRGFRSPIRGDRAFQATPPCSGDPARTLEPPDEAATRRGAHPWSEPRVSPRDHRVIPTG